VLFSREITHTKQCGRFSAMMYPSVLRIDLVELCLRQNPGVSLFLFFCGYFVLFVSSFCFCGERNKKKKKKRIDEESFKRSR